MTALNAAPPPRAVFRPALLLPAASVACLVAVAFLELRVSAAPGRAALRTSVQTGSGLTTGIDGLVLGALAALVLQRPEHRRFGLALGWFGLFWALDGAAESYVRWGLVSDRPLPGMTFAVWFLLRFTAFLPLTIAVLPLLFPSGRLLPGRWGAAGRACLTVMAASALCYVVVPYGRHTGGGPLPPGTNPDPTTVWALGPVADVLVPALQAAAIASLVVPVATVVVRHRASRGSDRDRMRWLLWGALITALVVAAALVVDVEPLRPVAFFLVVNLVPVTMTVAVLHPGLVPIERLLGTTLLYAVLAAGLLAVDLAVLTVLTTGLGDALGQRHVALVALLLTLALYGPLRLRLSAWVRRLVLGDRADPYDAMARLAATLESTDDGGEQLAAVSRAVASAFGVAFVSVEVDRDRGERLTASHGDRPADTRSLPISYRGTEVGRLVLPARGARSRLNRRDEQLLGDLVRQAATAARTTRLAEELQDSRERLVVAREEERRRIRRDLHDGLGPSLSGVVWQLESTRLLLERDPRSAADRLGATTALVQDVIADVRRLVHDLRPPALDDRGLAGALGQQADRLGASGIDARVEVLEDEDGLCSVPAAVEVAAYRIVSEALTNVVRHSGARRCVVRLRRTTAALEVEVSDDGSGIPEDAEVGVGLLSLRERAAELGGHTAISCPPSGGTLVRACLPVHT